MANNATFMMPRTLRLSDGAGLVDALTGLVLGAVLGTLTGYLWAIFNPIQLAPFIHLRVSRSLSRCSAWCLAVHPGSWLAMSLRSSGGLWQARLCCCIRPSPTESPWD